MQSVHIRSVHQKSARNCKDNRNVAVAATDISVTHASEARKYAFFATTVFVCFQFKCNNADVIIS